MSEAPSHPAHRAQDAQNQGFLDPDKVTATVEALHRCIEERFPGSGLNKVALRLMGIAYDTPRLLEEIEATSKRDRMVSILAASGLIVAVLLCLVLTIAYIELPTSLTLDVVQAVEAFIQEFVFVGIAVAFILNLANRVKRRRALAGLREIRAIIHLVDMHHLTKDPHRATVTALPNTSSSPRRDLSMSELGRYLDYCSEMLALASKFASMCAERFDDRVVLATVNDIETLSNGLSSKIWQKIGMLGLIDHAHPAAHKDR